MNRRRLFLYLLLNVFISACVTGAILFWYDRNYRATLAPVPAVVAPVGGESAAPVEILPPDEEVPIEIAELLVGKKLAHRGLPVDTYLVIGAGEMQRAQVKSKRSTKLDLRR